MGKVLVPFSLALPLGHLGATSGRLGKMVPLADLSSVFGMVHS